MTTNVSIKTSIKDNNWLLEFELNNDADIPTDIFMFINTGAGLGEYQGVCTLVDYRKLQTHVPGTDIPVFGNKFLKYNKGTMTFSIDIDPRTIKDKIVSDIKSFKAAYTQGSYSSENITI